ncbi:hypothetical protein [Clavibacter sp. Sh2088]|uniref:hypothetical protein n=1 Tax=Clavibacter sp. Sh2088 TaxID=3397676 RepID=UPI0039E1516D
MPIPARPLTMMLVVTAASLVGAMTAALGAAPSAVPHAAAAHQAAVARASVDSVARTAPAISRASTPAMTDADLDGLVAVLDALPDDIKSADPRTTPDYEHRLGQAIDRVTASSRIDTSMRSSTPDDALSPIGTGRAVHAADLRSAAPTVRLAIDWIACGAAVAGVIAQYGLPVF